MRRYETIIITDPDLSPEQRDPVLKRVAGVINQGDGYLALTDEWGARKLAYEIKKRDRGYYIRFDFCGTGAMVNEMERFFRIDDRVLKYMTVLLDKAADIEKIKEEMAAVQSKADKAKENAETAAAATPSEEPTEAQAETAEAPAVADEAQASEAQAETAEAPAVADEAQAFEAQAETAEAPTESDEAQASETLTESAEITPPQEPAETEKTQTPESEIGESEAALKETEEEKK